MDQSNETTKNGTEREGFAALLKAAEAGDASAARRVGDCYLKGSGVAKDSVQAVAWYRRGAEAGDALAIIRLSFCYMLGVGCKRDIQAVRFWRRRLSETGGEEILRKIDERVDGR